MEIYIPQIIITVIATIILSLSKYISHKLIKKYGELLQKTAIRRKQIRKIIAILLNTLYVFIVAIVWGVQPQNLLVGMSSVFAVIGVALFAQWSVLSNITAGIIMFFSPPFRLGNHIRILDKDMTIEATIENIQTFYTYLRTDEGELIVLPNNLFLQKTVSVKK